MEMISDFISEFFRLWQSGGILMWPLLFIAIYIYWNVFELFARFSAYDFTQIRKSMAENILNGNPDEKTLRQRLSIIRADYLPYFDRRLNFLSVLTGVSPLMGLLGTVMGMLSTFALMNRGSAQKFDLMAGGISEALITTQMGLIIAVPALFMIMMLRNRRNDLKHFFDKLENDCFRQAFPAKGGST